MKQNKKQLNLKLRNLIISLQAMLLFSVSTNGQEVHSGKIVPFNQRPMASDAGTPSSPWSF